jgi:uncharacterized protein YodC (DUF2158 family)
MSKHRSHVVGPAVIALCGLVCAWIGPARAEPAQPRASIERVATPVFAPGDLVHVRSGGPVMTVDKVDADQITCHWTDELGEMHSDTFSVADLSAPISLPAPDPHRKEDENAADRYYQMHCPSGFVTLMGQFKCAL